MSLAVKIFWAEDNSGWYDNARARLEQTFEDEFALEFCPQRFGSYREANAEIEGGLKGYDLALIDYRLRGGKNETGAALVENLRAKNPPVYTEVIFYSRDVKAAMGDLIGKGLGLSGIFLVGRGRSSDEFVEKHCLPIMKAVLAKVLDLTRNRGIVAAVASDIDAELTRLIGEHPDFEQKISSDFIVEAARNLHDKKGKTLDKKAASRSARDLLNDHMIAVWPVRMEIAKKLLGSAEIAKFEAGANSISQDRNKLVHHTAPGYSEEELQQIRRDTIQCKRLLLEAFSNPGPAKSE